MPKRKSSKPKGIAPKTRDYFAELYVAGLMGDHGWAIYFPKRDIGFDFIVSKPTPSGVLLRPVQVRGLYPTAAKTDKTTYGWQGKLTQVHPEMAVVVCLFSPDHISTAPEHVVFAPLSALKKTVKGTWRFHPVSYKKGRSVPRKTYKPMFDLPGLEAMTHPDWARSAPVVDDKA